MKFIEDFSTLIVKKMDTNPDWAESLALTMLSTFTGRSRRVVTKIGPLPFNLFTMFIGPSGLSNKTNPLRYVFIPTLIKIGEISGNKFMFPTRFSVEGLVEYMDQNGGQGCIVRDEFSSLFSSIANKAYLSEGLEFISEMYDGQIETRYTRKSKLEKCFDVYVTLTSATTPYVFSVMERDFFIQGTGNRILYIYDNPTTIVCNDLSGNDFLMTPYAGAQDYEEYCAMFAERLLALSKTIPRNIGFEFNAADIVADFRNDTRKRALQLYKEDWLNIEYSYLTRCAEFVLKISALKCISDNEDDITALSPGELLITVDNVKWAVDKVQKHIEYFHRMVNAWGSIALKKPASTEKSDFEYVKSIIIQSGGKVQYQDLRKITGYGNSKFQNIVNAMIDAGIIIGEEVPTGKPGRPPIFYRLAPI